MDSTEDSIRRFLYLDEIAHIVLENKQGVIAALYDSKIKIEDESDEALVQLVHDNRMSPELNGAILKLLSENPYLKNCVHCWDKISGTVNKVLEKKKS